MVVKTQPTQTSKKRLFTVHEYHRMAEAGIPEVWIINLQDDVVEVYREPAETGYKLIRRLDCSDSLAPLAFLTLNIPSKRFLDSRRITWAIRNESAL